ncbi:MAG TPA: glycosyltransferase family 39 protein [bacterium]|nr:glycosyltransferase family 39 protein [bacterium]
MKKELEKIMASKLVINEYLFLIVLFSLASLLRILYAFYLKGNIPVSDAAGFDLLGINILKYGQYAFQPGIPTAHRAPIYPLFLSGVYFLFGHSYLAVRIIQSLIGSLTCVAVYFIGRRIANKNVGVIAAIICVFYPFFIYYTGYLLVETLFTFLLAVAVYCLITSVDKPDWKNLSLGGAFMGLAALCKPTAFAFVPFSALSFLVILGIRKVSTYRNIGIFLLFFTITLSPWVIRNHIVFRRIIPSTTQLGFALLDGSLLFDAEHQWRIEQEEQKNPILLKGKELNEIEQNNYFTKEALKFIRNNPKYMMKLALRKFLKFWRLYPHTENIYTYGQSKGLLVLLSLLSYGILLPFSLLGIIFSIKNWKRFTFFYGLILSFTIIHLIVWSQIRYRLPIMPYMIIFAAFSLNFILLKAKSLRLAKRLKI